MSGDGDLFREVRAVLDSGGLNVDQAFDAVSDVTRRRVLFELEESGSVGLATLANRIVSATGEDGPDSVQQVYLSLYHRHVPKLVDLGLVNYDDEEGTVHVTETGSTLVSAFRRSDLEPAS